jgi:hypothetical protein
MTRRQTKFPLNLLHHDHLFFFTQILAYLAVVIPQFTMKLHITCPSFDISLGKKINTKVLK